MTERLNKEKASLRTQKQAKDKSNSRVAWPNGGVEQF